MKTLILLECPFNLGLKEPFPGKEPGVHKLPQWLKKHGLYNALAIQQVHTINAPPYTMDIDEVSGIRNADAIAAYAQQQADLVKQVVEAGCFPLVLGGDCSILTGSMLSLKQTGLYGLFFLDGHTDYQDVLASQTKAAAGMDLFIVTGNAHPKLSDIRHMRPYVEERYTWSVGNRWNEEAYVHTILSSAIRYINLQLLRELGPYFIAQAFLAMVEQNALDGFWIHFDADVLNDDIMPAVDSRQPDGLSYPELELLLIQLLSHPAATGMEITILDPELDSAGKYTPPFVESMARIFNAAAKSTQQSSSYCHNKCCSGSSGYSGLTNA